MSEPIVIFEIIDRIIVPPPPDPVDLLVDAIISTVQTDEQSSNGETPKQVKVTWPTIKDPKQLQLKLYALSYRVRYRDKMKGLIVRTQRINGSVTAWAEQEVTTKKSTTKK